jgi:ABC-2 type transport system ATP-binding protein
VTVISTEGLTKRYPSVMALDGLTLTVGPGVTGLVGANGAGKSTLIKILLGLLPATSGTARVLELDVATAGEQIRRRVGYMPEHDCLPPDVTATELVVHLGRMSGLPTTVARERAADTLRHVGLYEERYREIGGYSTGMRQRVKLAQALVHDPDLVMLDEPTNGLDPAGREEMLGLISRIGNDFGISVLVTSHLLGELERVSDHVVVVDAGRLIRSTSTAAAMSGAGVVTVEVTERADALAESLTASGWQVVAGSRHSVLDVRNDDDLVLDAVRDSAAALGVGLLRLEPRRHGLAEIFADAPEDTSPDAGSHSSDGGADVA